MSQDNSDRVVTGEVIRPSGFPDSSDGSPDEDNYQQTYLHKVASARPGAEDPTSVYPTSRSSRSPEDAVPEDAVPEDAAELRDTPQRATPSPTFTPATTEPEPEADPAVADSAEAEEQPGRHRADVPEARTEPGEPSAEETIPVPSTRRPGDEAVPPEMAGKLLTEGAEIREQWMRVQAAFVDDPRLAVTEAASLIDDVVARLQAAVRERQRALRGRWDADGQADTESLRVTMQQYRTLMEHIATL